MLRIEYPIRTPLGRQDGRVHLYIVNAMRVDVIVLASCGAHDAVAAGTLPGFGNGDGAADADEAYLVGRQCLNHLSEPASLYEDIINDEIVAGRGERRERAVETREKGLAERPEFDA